MKFPFIKKSVKSNPYFLLLIVLTIIFCSVGFYFFYQTQNDEEVYNPVPLSLIDKLRITQFPKNTECSVSDTVDFYYYENISEAEKRNNKFGLYIYAEVEDFFEIADDLVNSNGGRWGYVLIPYNIRDRDYSKWNRVFEELTEYELIPIIQLWDVNPSKYEEDTKKAAQFLNSFAWPIKQRYISVYNETNDAKFWKGSVDPKNYAEVLNFTIDTFKAQNENFFIMNGAFNVSANTSSQYLDSFTYMYEMDKHIPGIFNKLDAWASHPYPQPNFSGNVYATGRNSIRAYETELNYLYETLGVTKELPVFITETGWAHAEGRDWDNTFYTAEEIGNFFVAAFSEVWLPDERVVAVTPFTIKYDHPFDHFSWVNEDNFPYPHYNAVKKMEKVDGNPEVLVGGTVNYLSCPD